MFLYSNAFYQIPTLENCIAWMSGKHQTLPLAAWAFPFPVTSGEVLCRYWLTKFENNFALGIVYCATLCTGGLFKFHAIIRKKCNIVTRAIKLNTERSNSSPHSSRRLYGVSQITDYRTHICYDTQWATVTNLDDREKQPTSSPPPGGQQEERLAPSDIKDQSPFIMPMCCEAGRRHVVRWWICNRATTCITYQNTT